MPNIIQPNQVVTYKKKITLRKPENTKNSFWEEFFKTLSIQVFAAILGTLTAGIGTAIIAPLGFSQLGIATSSFLIQSTINFGITEAFDIMYGNVTTESTLLNLLFSVSDIGQFGRALKYDKLLKLTNQAKIYEKIGINSRLKNFYQLKQSVMYKDILVGKTKFAFKKEVTDIEILNLISNLVQPQTKKALKNLSLKEMNLYLDMQKTLHRINPKLVNYVSKKEITNFDFMLKKYKNISINDFFKMNDLEASKFVVDLAQTSFGYQKILKMNNARIQSKFQETFFNIFKSYKKIIKVKIDKINPLKLINKIVKKIFEPINQTIATIKKHTSNIFVKWNKLGQNLIKKLNLIPCHIDSFLLGFKFEPSSISGEGFCTIYKNLIFRSKLVK